MRALAALVIGMVATGLQPALANPADTYGLGARIPAMGGAGTAHVRDTAAGYYNPAGIGLFEHIRIDLGYQYARPNLRINDRSLEVDASRGIAAGLAVPGRIGSFKAALAGTFFLPDRYFLRTRSLSGGQPRFQLFDNRAQRFIFSVNLGASWKDRIAVGGGVTYMSATKGTVDLVGRIGFPDADDSELRQGIDVDTTTVAYPQAGLIYKANDWLDLGFSYRGQFQLDIDLTVNISGSVGSDESPIVEDGFVKVQSLAKDHFQPAQFTIGAAAHVSDDLLIAADLGVYRWSRFENPATIIDLDLDVGEFNDQIDLSEGPVFPDPAFRDILVPRIGVEWTALTRPGIVGQVRGGYTFEPSPAPEQKGENNFVDNDKHTLSLGAGVVLEGVTELIPLPFSLDFFLSVMLLPDRQHSKETPSDPVGDYVSSGSVVQVGTSSSWNF